MFSQATTASQSRLELPNLAPGSSYVALVRKAGSIDASVTRVEFSTPEVSDAKKKGER